MKRRGEEGERGAWTHVQIALAGLEGDDGAGSHAETVGVAADRERYWWSALRWLDEMIQVGGGSCKETDDDAVLNVLQLFAGLFD